MARRSAANPRWISWTGLVYYGETLGFVAAWIVGAAAILYSTGEPETPHPRVEQVASADTDGLALAD